MKKSVQIIVRGKVQGVYFRQSTLLKAEELQITGIAKNLPSGEVYIEAEGEEDVLEELIDWCRDEGSQSSIVTSVKVNDQPLKHYTKFLIVR